MATPFFLDTFTEAANTSLDVHTPETGGTWNEQTTAAGQVSSADYLANTATISGLHFNNVTPPTSDYSVTGSFKLNATNVSTAIGPGIRINDDRSGYCALIYNGSFYISRRAIGGDNASLIAGPIKISGYAHTKEYTISITAFGSTLYGCVIENGVTVSMAQATDATYAGPGKPGIVILGINPVCYNLEAQSVVKYTVDPDDLSDNVYDNVATPRQSPFARLAFTTTASILTITGTTDIYSVYPNNAKLGLRYDGVNQTSIAFTANGAKTISLAVPGSGTRTGDITAGFQNYSSGIKGTYIDSVIYPTDELTIIPPTTRDRIVVYGDSIATGAFATDIEYNGWAMLLRSYGKKVLLEGYGGRSLHADTNTTILEDAFVSRIAGYSPNIIYLEIGANDYYLNKQSAANFKTAYNSLIDKLVAAIPGVRIICQTFTMFTSEIANTFGNTMDDYRTAVSEVCATKQFCTLLDCKTLLVSGDLVDFAHPNSGGHLKIAQRVNTAVDTMGKGVVIAGF